MMVVWGDESDVFSAQFDVAQVYIFYYEFYKPYIT